MTLRMGHSRFYIISMSLIILACSGLFYAGYWLGKTDTINRTGDSAVRHLRMQLAQEKKKTKEVTRTAQAYINRLSQHLGLLKAHVIRLNAFGSRLTKMANLDAREFNFNSAPAIGGPYKPINGTDNSTGFAKEIGGLSQILKDREGKFSALESMLLHTNVLRKAEPEGKPVRKGWMSSTFGSRRDPFTGRRTYHDGIDYAARSGTPIYSVAAGVVTASGRRGGYGNTVEVDHGNGVVSRYAHCKRNLVKVGDKVSKGQKIALLGSTGRSTGPHVHYEILKHGKPINPHQFMVSNKKSKK